MLKVNQKVIYPAHGLSIVKKIDTKTVGGKSVQFYILDVVNSGMTILVPISDTEQLGVREIISKEKAIDILTFLAFGGKKVENNYTWNRRYREYLEKLQTGSIDEIAYVVVALRALRLEKDLSFGERKMLNQAQSLLESELVEALGREVYSEYTA